jgi:hypothetical protein
MAKKLFNLNDELQDKHEILFGKDIDVYTIK